MIKSIFLHLLAGTIGWNIATFYKEYQMLKAKAADINTFCLDKPQKFTCNIQILPDGRKIIYVSEKK